MAPNETSLETPEKQSISMPFPLVAAAGFLTVVVLLTGYFIYRTSALDSAIEAEKKHSAEYQTNINTLKSDPSVQAAEILAQSKKDIVTSIERSVVSRYIRELEKLHRDYLLQFTGFSYQAGRINTTVTAEKGLSDDAVRKVIRIIADYRNDTLTGSLLLSPVTNVNGNSEERTLGVEFKLK